MKTRIPGALSDRAEAEAYFDFVQGADERTRQILDLETAHVAGAAVLSARNDSSGFWSRAQGLGHDSPLTSERLDEVCGYFRGRGHDSALLYFDSDVLPDDWAALSARHGLSAGPKFAKLVADVDTVLTAAGQSKLDPSLRIAPATSDDAPTWGSVMCEIFGWSDVAGLPEMCAASVTRPEWAPFAVWAGERMVGTANSHRYAGTAHMFGGGTLPEFRNRGAQTALLLARAEAAAAAGCTWLVAEAYAPEDNSNPSLTNMLRLGFEEYQRRPLWRWSRTEEP
ncbi:GNAT family N-acetyltransferase [Amycolatopsis sp. NPDC049253]|uniref:GNAT family N-acetyltransferase n=1 Tax=Amycolatopsis sp. NPDC049253 TaxID=3155274 RepID=UPI00341EF1AA